jgi:hypothetical protein
MNTRRNASARHGGVYRIPRIIYTYWNSSEPPAFVTACMNTWRRYLPSYKVVLITPSSLAAYLPPGVDVKALHWNDGPQRESDIIRACVLHTHGGVWMDASIVLTRRPAAAFDMIERGNHQFVAYAFDKTTSDPRYPVIENWFFATVPRGRFMAAWKSTFLDVKPGQTPAARARELQRAGVDTQRISNLPYFLMHVCAQAVMQQGEAAANRDCAFLRADDGPLWYIAALLPPDDFSPNAWTSTKHQALDALRKIRDHHTQVVHGMIKIPSYIRRLMASEDWAALTA